MLSDVQVTQIVNSIDIYGVEKSTEFNAVI